MRTLQTNSENPASTSSYEAQRQLRLIELLRETRCIPVNPEKQPPISSPGIQPR